MSNIQIRHITENDIEGFYACLDAVARERKYLGLTKALPLENIRKWLMKAMERGEIRITSYNVCYTKLLRDNERTESADIQKTLNECLHHKETSLFIRR